MFDGNGQPKSGDESQPTPSLQLPRARLHGGFIVPGRITPTSFPGCLNAASSEYDPRIFVGMMMIQSTEIHQSAIWIKAEQVLCSAALIIASITVKFLFIQYNHTAESSMKGAAINQRGIRRETWVSQSITTSRGGLLTTIEDTISK